MKIQKEEKLRCTKYTCRLHLQGVKVNWQKEQLILTGQQKPQWLQWQADDTYGTLSFTANVRGRYWVLSHSPMRIQDLALDPLLSQQLLTSVCVFLLLGTRANHHNLWRSGPWRSNPITLSNNHYFTQKKKKGALLDCLMLLWLPTLDSQGMFASSEENSMYWEFIDPKGVHWSS